MWISHDSSSHQWGDVGSCQMLSNTRGYRLAALAKLVSQTCIRLITGGPCCQLWEGLEESRLSWLIGLVCMQTSFDSWHYNYITVFGESGICWNLLANNIRYAKHIYLPEPHTRKRAITAVKAEEVVSTKLMTRAFVFMIVLKKSDMQLLF